MRQISSRLEGLSGQTTKKDFFAASLMDYLFKELWYLLFNKQSWNDWVSQKLPQMCTASAQVYRKSIPKQMQYRFAVNFGTLSTWYFFGGGGLRPFKKVLFLEIEG